MVALATLDHVLDRLASFTTTAAPVVSLYLDLKPDSNGRQTHQAFATKALAEQVDTFASSSVARAALERDARQIRDYLASQQPARHSLAIFACGEHGFFEAVPLDAYIGGHRLYVDHEPHLFPLARLAERHGAYAALLVNTNSARLFVVATGAIQRAEHVTNEKMTRVSVGGWSQARYQRHVDNLYLKHIKEVVAALERVVREDRVDRIIVSGDEVAIPLLKSQLPVDIETRIVDVLRLDIRTPDHEVLHATLDALRLKDAETDRERVETVLDAYRAGGLATIGVAGVRAAFELGQVDRLLVPASPASTAAERSTTEVETSVAGEQRSRLDESTIEELVTQARRTDAAVTFIEDAALLEPVRGVAAMLRFRL